MLFTKYLPIGCNNKTQEVWILDLEADLVASIGHETVPEDWPDEEWELPDVWIHCNLL